MRLSGNIRKKMCIGIWFLYHDNAPSYSMLLIREFSFDKNIPVVLHLLYSPNLTPCDFFFFPK